MSKSLFGEEGVLREYMQAQTEEMLRHKWIESERAGYDLGQECLLEWVRCHAANFRENFMTNLVTQRNRR